MHSNQKPMVTVFTSSETDLNKTLSIKNSVLIKHSNGQFFYGIAQVESPLTLRALGELIIELESNQAIGLGLPTINGNVVAHELKVTTREKLSSKNKANTVARTKDFFTFPKKQPAFMLFDIDKRNDRAGLTREEVLQQLQEIDPKLKTCGYLIVPSSSSFIYSSDGNEIVGAAGWHVYVMVNDASLIPDYGKWFEVQAWLKGFGYILLSQNGSQLTRNLVDSAVFSPERLVFESAPTLKSGLTSNKPNPKAVKADVMLILTNADVQISREEQKQFDELVAQAKAENEPESLTIKQRYVEQEAENIVAKNPTVSIKEAKAQVEQSLSTGKLIGHQILLLDDGTEVTVNDVLAASKQYHLKTLHDPFEPDQGRNRAKIYVNDNGSVVVHSQLHGGRSYVLSKATKVKAVAKVASEDEFAANEARFNENHASTMFGSKHKIIRSIPEKEQLKHDFVDVSELKKLYASEKILVATEDKDIKVDVFTAWFYHGKPKTYIDGVVYKPYPYGTSNPVKPTVFNLWSGFAVKPNRIYSEGLDLIIDHIISVICGGNEDDAEYILKWFASGVQKPEKTAGVAVVLRGRKGTGKSIIGNFFKNIYGVHGFVTSNPQHLVGRFSGHLLGISFVYADEAIYTGDVKGEAIIKALITEPTVAVEPKNLAVIQMENTLKIFMTTNSEYVVPATSDERRYFVVDVENSKIGDKAYFDALAAACNDPAVQADFLALMLELDLTDFVISEIPETAALQDQRKHTLKSEQKWLYESLVNGSFDGGVWKAKVSSENLFLSYVAWCESNRVYTNARKNKADISKYLGEIGYREAKVNNLRGRNFGKLTEAISLFEQYEKVKINED